MNHIEQQNSLIKLLEFIQFQKMFGWLSRCWGGMGVTNDFERWRLQCTYADWSVPNPEALLQLLKTLRGQNAELNAQVSMNSFLSHFQQDDEKINGAFLLKNLVILDLVVEQRIFLTKIGNYYNSQLLEIPGQGREMSSYVKDLIASYYIYIKEKAKLFANQSFQLGNKRTRVQFIQKCSVSQILSQLNICFKIQTLILDVSDKFNRGNKSPELIQMIFSCLLKTYLFCYSIVSISLKIFIERIPTLNRHDLQYLQKLANYINREYTRNFLLFIERNKIIECFKQIKYTELIILDEKVCDIIAEELEIMDSEENRKVNYQLVECPSNVQNVDVEVHQPLVVDLELGSKYDESDKNGDQDVKVRKNFLVELRKSGQADEHYFKNYVNFFHQNFLITDENGLDSPQKSHMEVFKQKNFGSALKYSYKGLMEPKLKKQYTNMSHSRKMEKKTWENWENVYSPPPV